MSVRLKIALTIFLTGALTLLGVIATAVTVFQRFERETTYYRADGFLARVAATYDNLYEMHERHPDEFGAFLRGLVLFEPDTQLYLLAADGTVLASSGSAVLAPGFKVELGPVREAVGPNRMPYVMGDDPERMDANAVIAARPVRRAVIRSGESTAGYLYLVVHRAGLADDRLQALGSSFTKPGLVAIAGIVLVSTVLAWWIVAAVTRPLSLLGDAVAAVSRDGVAGRAQPALDGLAARKDEFGQLAVGFRAMLATLGEQWAALRRLDHFRREGVSNLSHDLRSPLTATAACLETLHARWIQAGVHEDDARLLDVARRNTANAARLVQALGDLAQLDEPGFELRLERLDLTELLDGVAMRFAERGARLGITLEARADDAAVVAEVDVELAERAIANLVDNALKFCRPGDRVCLTARTAGDDVQVSVEDDGPGIPGVDLPHLFNRFYQSRQGVAPATAEGGKGLGLAIVQRIAELHGGRVAVRSEPGRGTTVTLEFPQFGLAEAPRIGAG